MEHHYCVDCVQMWVSKTVYKFISLMAFWAFEVRSQALNFFSNFSSFLTIYIVSYWKHFYINKEYILVYLGVYFGGGMLFKNTAS